MSRRCTTRWLCVATLLATATAAIASAPASAQRPGQRPPSAGRGKLTTPAGDRPDGLQLWADQVAASTDGTAAVEILLDPGAAEAAIELAVRATGGRVTGSVPGQVVQAALPPRGLDVLRTTPGVRGVRRPLPQSLRDSADPDAFGQALTGDEVAHVNAAAWHTAGRTGAGIRIGIVDGFDGATWDAAAATGDVPAVPPERTFCVLAGEPCSIWDQHVEHGVAVAELIHEVAPDAELYLVTAFTASDLQAAVDWFAANGVTVVNRSLGAPLDGPGDGTGPLDAVVDNAVAQGIAWFNSAGNEAGRSGAHGTYYRAKFSDPNGDGYHSFGAWDDLLMQCDGSLNSSLRWSDWGDASSGWADATDYDLLAFDEFGNLLDNSGQQVQGPWPGGGNPPLEHLSGVPCVPGTAVFLQVRMYEPNNGAAGDVIEIMAEAPLELWSNPYSAGYPIVDSRNSGVFAIGAVEADHSVAYYSSEGPTADGRVKPDFVARSNVVTRALPSFEGTSAASPIAAGMAALVRGAGLAATPAELRAWLLANAARDGGASGPDTEYGYGELVLPDPAAPPAPTPVRPAGDLTAEAIVPVAPARLLDTRGEPTVDGAPSPFGPGGGQVVPVAVGGRNGLPADAAGVVANLTVVGPTGAGYATLFPCGQVPPNASHLNFLPGEVVANNVVVPLGEGGRVCVYASAAADFLLDVNGYVPADSPMLLVGPARYLDTRPGGATFDGGSLGSGTVLAGGIRDVPIAGRGAVLAGATAAVVSVTAVNPLEPGFVSLYPCSGDPAAASTLNYSPGQFVPNGAVVQLSPQGSLCVFTSGTADLLLDVAGYVPAGVSKLTTRPAERLFDSRPGSAAAHPDGRLAASGAREIQVAGRAGVPAGAKAALLNVGTVLPDGAGFVTLWPCGPQPVASNLNHVSGGVVRANNAVTQLSPTGTVCVFTLSAADLIVDITGWLG